MILEVVPTLNTLAVFRYKPKFRAEDGKNGGKHHVFCARDRDFLEHDVRPAAPLEGVAVKARAFGGRQFRSHRAVVETHAVVAGRRLLGLVPEARAVARVGIRRRAGIEPPFARRGHEQEIAEVGMSRAAEMRVAEANDRRVIILITGAIGINFPVIFPVFFITYRIRIRAQLNHPEWNRGPRISVTHSLGTDQWINILY